jgi:hypothetical protein
MRKKAIVPGHKNMERAILPGQGNNGKDNTARTRE